MKWRFHAIFAVGATIVVVLTVGWGFMLVGSPTTRWLERIDERRVKDLQIITREIESMVLDQHNKGTLKSQLPKTLDEAIQRSRHEKLNVRDPVTRMPYGFTVKNETTFELCATFARKRDEDNQVFWNHPAGSHCFTINVLDIPEMFPY